MRIPIREQLALLIATTTVIALVVLAIATWTESHRSLLEMRSTKLRETANLKAAQMSQILQLYSNGVQAIGTRYSLQDDLQAYNEGNGSQDLLRQIEVGVQGALSGSGKDALFLQAAVFPRSNATAAGTNDILHVTGEWAKGTIQLPYAYINGSKMLLGDDGLGYPPLLYPNLTYIDGPTNVSNVAYESRTLHSDSVLVLGPLYLNNSSSLVSMTVAINNNTSRDDILGWLTVVMDARLLYGVIASPVGLDNTGEALLIGPITNDNLFPHRVEGEPSATISNVPVWYVLPPASNSKLGNRHGLRTYETGNPDLLFSMSAYPAVVDAWSLHNDQINNAGSFISSYNEEGRHVSVGYAQIQSPFVDWVLLFEQSYAEVIAPIHHFRDIILIYIFSVIGAILIICFPLAHYAVSPILALRSATQQSIALYQEDDYSQDDPNDIEPHGKTRAEDMNMLVEGNKGGVFNGLHLWKSKRPKQLLTNTSSRQRVFRIPQRVPARRHFLHDELTDLTGTFNEMSDELTVQYTRLEERVRARTAELEQSRNAAQVANESKTLFVANISHELRTPLNGILGMCAIALHEKDTSRVRQALKIIYKSGDLLLHLLNDLLTFSRNSYGQQLLIEEEAFRLSEISTQIMSIFDKQARDAQIDLKVVYLGPQHDCKGPSDDTTPVLLREPGVPAISRTQSSPPAYGPGTTGPVSEMSLCGDKNRILQILMNLVSNSLKFTPLGGAIEVRIRCVGYVEDQPTLSRSKSIAIPAEDEVRGRAHIHQFVGLSEAPTATTDLRFEFEVEDTGPGIPDHLQQEIFKPFVQGDLALSKKFGGTGLGLAICTQLATLMHGEIKLKSTISVGSTFTLSMPLQYLKERAHSISSSVIRSGSKRTNSIPNSFVGRSHQDETGSLKHTGRDTSPGRASVYSGSSQPMDVPRIVGFSQPYLADSAQDDDSPPAPKPSNLSPPCFHRKETLTVNRPSGPVSRPTLHSSLSGIPPPKAKVPATTVNTNSSTGSGTKVLVAEDNKVNQEVILRMLRLERVQNVKVAQDGQEALDIVASTMNTPDGQFAVVFMDIQMPNLDGIQSTRLIRKLGYSAPIIALTAFADESNRKDCMEAGMNAFLSKPIKRSALKEVLRDFTMPKVDEACVLKEASDAGVA